MHCYANKPDDRIGNAFRLYFWHTLKYRCRNIGDQNYLCKCTSLCTTIQKPTSCWHVERNRVHQLNYLEGRPSHCIGNKHFTWARMSWRRGNKVCREILVVTEADPIQMRLAGEINRQTLLGEGHGTFVFQASLGRAPMKTKVPRPGQKWRLATSCEDTEGVAWHSCIGILKCQAQQHMRRLVVQSGVLLVIL